MVRLLIACSLLVAASAAAKGWPTPAAGDSASGDPEVVFTFDDGPSPTTTPKVLDILAAHHVHAVFFLVGEMAGSENKRVPAIVQRILREGHVIATHTMTHKDLCRVPEAKAVSEIDDGKAVIDKVSGVQTLWFRAPYGTRCQRLEDMLAARHMEHFHWDLDPQEWKHGDAKKAVAYVTGSLARSSGRNVLLMHDIKVATVKALPEILAWIDDENAKREKAHKRPIRIVQAPDLARERLPKGMVAWLETAIAGTRSLPAAVASVLP